jgi:hypothetical protein
MLNYLKKFALEILPSVAATVIGAYIVNHYISNRPAADAPVAAAVSPADTKKNAKPVGRDVASIPEHGITARGISERAMMEKSASERPGEFKPAEAKSSEAKSSESKALEAKSSEAKSSEAKSSEAKSSETKPEAKPSEKHPTASAQPKAVAKAIPAPAASPVETASAPAEDHRDANDLARAAIERLRKEDSQSHAQEASRAPDTPRLQDAPRTVVAPMATASVRPLPPPITVIAPPVEGQGNNQGNDQPNVASNPPPYTASINSDNPNRLVPPADIPPPPPIDLRAGANKLATRTTNMAQDVLAKTRSMFHALLPGANGDADNGGGQGQSSSASQFTD